MVNDLDLRVAEHEQHGSRPLTSTGRHRCFLNLTFVMGANRHNRGIQIIVSFYMNLC